MECDEGQIMRRGHFWPRKYTNLRGEFIVAIAIFLPCLLRQLFMVDLEAKELNWGEVCFKKQFIY